MCFCCKWPQLDVRSKANSFTTQLYDFCFVLRPGLFGAEILPLENVGLIGPNPDSPQDYGCLIDLREVWGIDG